MIQTIKMNLDDTVQLANTAKALSSETRIEILKQLRLQDRSVNELSELLNIPPASSNTFI